MVKAPNGKNQYKPLGESCTPTDEVSLLSAEQFPSVRKHTYDRNHGVYSHSNSDITNQNGGYNHYLHIRPLKVRQHTERIRG